MSETKKPLKWYWAYESHKTFVFDTYEQAFEHASEHGEFDEICGKESMMEYENELFFEVLEEELKEYSNVEFPCREVAA